MKIQEVEKCRLCPFHGITMDGMSCEHPYWRDKGAYERHIITHETMNGIPDKCPLKDAPSSFTTVVKLKNGTV